MSANTPEKDLAPVPVDPWILADVAYARYHDPHEVLGAHVKRYDGPRSERAHV